MDENKEPGGFLSGLSSSVQSHLDERLKSPFAGAFAIAWLICNWKAVLILCFSQLKIEDRIELLDTDHFSTWSTLWAPLIFAVAIALSFYVLSAGFYFILQAYQSLQLQIERIFDERAKWLPPSRVIAQKKKYADRISSLEGMAADNAAEIEQANQRALDAAAKNTELQQELIDRSSQLGKLSEELSQVKERQAFERARADKLKSDSDALTKENKRLVERLEFDRKTISEYFDQLASSPKPSARSPLQELLDDSKLKSSGFWRVGPHREQVNLDSLSNFLATRYPGLVVDRALVGLILKDIRSSGLSSKLSEISQIEEAIERASDAVGAYSERRPDLFRKAADYLSKSLGFVFEEFRNTHKFGADTKKALKEFEGLVRK